MTKTAVKRSTKSKTLAKDNVGSQSIGRASDFTYTFSSRNLDENRLKEADKAGMSTFQTRFSRESSKNNILGTLNEFFVSAKPVDINHKISGA